MKRLVVHFVERDGRLDCEIHAANFAADAVDQDGDGVPEVTQVHGCTEVGDGYGDILRKDGKTQWGNEREFHHYGSTLNAVPVLDSYRAYPARSHLLRLGACALLGHLSNIHPSGAASMAWHGDPALLRRDAFSGDYGIGLYGYWRPAASYVACMPPHGSIARTRTSTSGMHTSRKRERACSQRSSAERRKRRA
jgi:hypothetical protein